MSSSTVAEEVAWFESHIKENAIPSDGLVLTYDDIAYGQSLGTTAKFPRDSIAFKWADETRETVLQEIESVSYTHLRRTGLSGHFPGSHLNATPDNRR